MFYGGMFIGILWAVNLGEIVILPPQFAGGTSWTSVHYGCRVRISQKTFVCHFWAFKGFSTPATMCLI